MALKGDQGQPTAPNVPGAAMKSILPEVQRKEERKSRRRRAGAGAAEGGDSGVRTRGQKQTGQGGKELAGASEARQATGHQEGKGGIGAGQGRQWPQLPHSVKQPPGSPPHVSAAVRPEEEREARRQQTARYEALAHMERQRRRHQAPRSGPATIYQRDMGFREGTVGAPGWAGEDRRGARQLIQWRRAERVEADRAEQQSSGVAPRPAGGGGESGSQRSGEAEAVQGRGAGREEQWDRHSGQGARGIGKGQGGLPGKGQGKARYRGAGSRGQGKAGRTGKGHGKVGGLGCMGTPVFRPKGMGWWGGVVPPAISPFPPPPYPAVGMVYPPPTGVPGCVVASACAAAPAGRQGGVGSTEGGRERSTEGHVRG